MSNLTSMSATPSDRALWSRRQALLALPGDPRGVGRCCGHMAPDRHGRAVGFQEPLLPDAALSRRSARPRRAALVEPLPLQRPPFRRRSAIAALHADDGALRLARAAALDAALRRGRLRPSPARRARLRAALPAARMGARRAPSSRRWSSCSAARRPPASSIPVSSSATAYSRLPSGFSKRPSNGAPTGSASCSPSPPPS